MLFRVKYANIFRKFWGFLLFHLRMKKDELVMCLAVSLNMMDKICDEIFNLMSFAKDGG